MQITGFRLIEVWEFFDQNWHQQQTVPGECTEAHFCHAMTHCLVYDGNKKLSSSAGPHLSGSEQRDSLIVKHSSGCIKQNAFYKVMKDIYFTPLSTNDIPEGIQSSLGATIDITINPHFPFQEENSDLCVSREIIADECSF